MTDPTEVDAIIVTVGAVIVAAINAVVILLVNTRRKVQQNTDAIGAVDDKVNGRMSELINLLSSARDHLIDGTPFHPDEIPAVVNAVGPPPPPPVTLVFGRAWATSEATATPGAELPPPDAAPAASSSSPTSTDTPPIVADATPALADIDPASPPLDSATTSTTATPDTPPPPNP